MHSGVVSVTRDNFSKWGPSRSPSKAVHRKFHIVHVRRLVLLDKEWRTAGALSHAINDLLWQRMAGGESLSGCVEADA
jgi:hypothetical protein